MSSLSSEQLKSRSRIDSRGFQQGQGNLISQISKGEMNKHSQTMATVKMQEQNVMFYN